MSAVWVAAKGSLVVERDGGSITSEPRVAGTAQRSPEPWVRWFSYEARVVVETT